MGRAPEEECARDRKSEHRALAEQREPERGRVMRQEQDRTISRKGRQVAAPRKDAGGTAGRQLELGIRVFRPSQEDEEESKDDFELRSGETEIGLDATLLSSMKALPNGSVDVRHEPTTPESVRERRR